MVRLENNANLCGLNPDDTSGTWSSSSQATSIASGVVALMVAENPCMTPGEIETAMKDGTMPVNNADDPDDPNDIYYGQVTARRLNAYEALKICAGLNSTYIISEDTDWDSQRYVNQDVIVQDGATLTVTTTLRMEEGIKIVINPGGRMIVDGGTLTNACGGRWEGIIVQGDENLSQDINPLTGEREQGSILIRNGSVIENATFGVRLYDPSSTTTSGGVIIALNSTFRNNYIGVNFGSFQNTNIITGEEQGNASRFNSCTFITNDDMIPGDPGFLHHVDLLGVDGIVFTGCGFFNEQSQNNIELRGQGIRALDSDFQVVGLCNSPNPNSPCTDFTFSEFRGLANGILAGNKGGINTFRVDRANFQENHFGIAGYATDNCSITRCGFRVGALQTAQSNPYVGLLLDGASGFKVEENDFQGFADASGETIGSVIRNSGNDINEIYKNEYSDLNFANVANGDNKGLAITDGLGYYCNENETNRFDFAVPSTSFLDSGIAERQGSETEATGNTFTGNPSTGETHFQNQLEDIQYFYFGQGSNQEPEDEHITEETVEKILIFEANLCPSKLPDGRDREFVDDDEMQQSVDMVGSQPTTKEGIYALNRLIRALKTNTEEYDYAAIRSYLETKGDYEAKCDLVDCYIQEGAFTDAFNILEAIDTDLSLTQEETERYTNFQALKKIQIQGASLSNEELLSQNMDELLLIAGEKYGVASAQAYYWLGMEELNRSGNFTHQRIALPRSEERNDTAESLIEKMRFSLSPNPAKEETTFYFSLKQASDLQIFNLEGQLQYTAKLNKEDTAHTLNTSDFPAGIYFYSVALDAETIKQGKLVIVK